MDEETTKPQAPTRAGHGYLIRKDHIVPENAEPISDTDIITIQEQRIARFKPQSEVRVFTWGHGSIIAAVGLSSVIINTMFRQNFKLGGLRKVATYLPVLVPPVTSHVFHDYSIKKKILVGREKCSSCVSVRSGLYQVGFGVIYPYVISFLICLPIAREHHTLPLPPIQASNASAYLRLFRHVSPAPTILLGLAVAHMLFGMKIASAEMKVFNKHLRHPLTAADLPPGMAYGK